MARVLIDMFINGKEYIDCPECPKCKKKDTLKNGVKWGICGMGGNTVYLEPWKEKRVSGNGYIKHPVSGCGMYLKECEQNERE